MAGVLSVLIVVTSGFAFAYYNELNGNVKRVNVFGYSAKVNRPQKTDNGSQNILLVGNDSRNGATQAQLQEADTTSDGGGVNTDTIILMHIAGGGGPVTFVSFPRDSVVDIPGHKAFKINSAYADGEADHAKDPSITGPGLLTETVENLAGVRIDHFVMVNFFQFIDISNAIGGVNVCVNGEAGYDPYTHANFTKPGTYTLKGSTALQYVRQRHYLPGDDFGRIQRQQRFITAMVKKVKGERNPLTVNQILQKATKSLTVDTGLSGTGLVKLADRLKDIDLSKIQFLTIPTVDKGGKKYLAGYGDQVDYVKIDPDAVKAYFANIEAGRDPNYVPPQPAETASPLPVSQVSVEVLNGSGVNGAAAATRTALEGYGFQVASIGDAAHGTTTIRYADADAGAARTLAKAVPGAALVQDSSLTGGTVQLIIGTDFTSVQDPSTATSTPSAPSTPSSGGSSDTATAANQNCGP
ncbi:MAG TPA: LCP family protein [Mycobacteriales bacterium]|nr:LCP family protein [Mycobacteriales bacterium]